MIETLKALGTTAAWLVHGADGTDELSICGPSTALVLKDGKITETTVNPQDAGLPAHPFESILGGSAEQNVSALRALLDGAPGAYRDAVLLNSAAALMIAGKAASLPDGVALAATSIDSGAARAKAAALAAATQA